MKLLHINNNCVDRIIMHNVGENDMYLDATSKYEKKTLNQLTFKPKQKVGIQKR